MAVGTLLPMTDNAGNGGQVDSEFRCLVWGSVGTIPSAGCPLGSLKKDYIKHIFMVMSCPAWGLAGVLVIARSAAFDFIPPGWLTPPERWG